MSIPILIGKVRRFGTGVKTELIFTEDVPARTSIVGCFASWYPNLTAHYFSSTQRDVEVYQPFGGPFPYYNHDVTEGFESNSVLYPPGNNFLPDPAWETFNYGVWAGDITHSDLPYSYRITDEAGNFYGWDGRDASEDFDAFGGFTDHYWNTRFDKWGGQRGTQENDVFTSFVGGTIIWFSCHNINGITSGQKLVIEHPGPILASITPSLSYSELPAVFIAGVFRVDGIKALPTDEKLGTAGTFTGTPKRYYFYGNDYWLENSSGGLLLRKCDSSPVDGFIGNSFHVCPWPSPAPSNIVPLTENEWWWDLDSYYQGLSAHPVTPKFLMFANLFGGINNIDSVVDVSSSTGLEQIMLYGTEEGTTFERITRINFPDPDTIENYPWDHLLEIRYHNLRNGDVSSLVYRTDALFGTFGGGNYGGIHDIFILNQITDGYRNIWNDVYAQWVAYPIRLLLDSLDMTRLVIGKQPLVFYSDDGVMKVDRLTDGEDNSVEETVIIDDTGDCKTPAVQSHNDNIPKLIYLRDEEVIYAVSRDSGKTWNKMVVGNYGTLATYAWEGQKADRAVFMFYESGEWLCAIGTLQDDGTLTLSALNNIGVNADEVLGTLDYLGSGRWEFLYKDTDANTWKIVRCSKLNPSGSGTWS